MLDFSQVKQLFIPQGEVTKITNLEGITLWQKISRILKEWRGLSPLTCTPTVADNFEEVRVYGNSKQQILPDGYTQLKYIESTGTQYIDTRIVPTVENETEIIVDITRTSINSPSMGANNNLNIVANLSYWRVNAVTTTRANITGEFVTIYLKQTSEGRYFKIDNIEGYGSVAQSNFSFHLCKLNGGESSTYFLGKIKKCLIKEKNILVRNLIPAKRNSDNEVGMYDTVSNTFLTNAGTGEFVAGGDYVPTPDTPIEIESVGDRTKNLFNENDEGIVYGRNISASGTETSSSISSSTYYIEVKPNTDYTITFTSLFNSSVTRYHLYDANKTWLQQIKTNSSSSPGKTETVNFTTTSDTQYLRFTMRGTSASEIKDGNIQLEEGDTATSYEPYGYKVPVVVSGKNLFNPDVQTYKGYIQPGGVGEKIRYGSSTVSKSYLKTHYIRKGKYVYSFDGSTRTGSLRFCVCDDDEIILFTQACTVAVGRNEFVLDIPVDGWVYVATLIETNNIQIEQGDTATSYVPYVQPITTNVYINEPLRKVGEYADTLTVEGTNVTVVRNIESYNATKLTNTLQYYGTYSSHNLFYFDIGGSIVESKYNTIAPLSNIFKGLTFKEAGGGASKLNNYGIRYQFLTAGTNLNRIYFNFDGVVSASDMLIRLAELNTEIITILTTPTTETYTIDTPINALDNTTIIDIDTTIKPSEIYASQWIEQ